MKHRIFSCLLVLLVVVMAAQSLTVQAQDKKPIDKVRVGISSPVANLDPRRAMGAPSYQAAILMAAQLFRWDQDRQPQPDLVDSYTVSDDGMTYTMKLRPNLKYSDGSPITVEDIAATWDQIKEAAPVNKTLINPRPTLTTPDASTLVWKLGTPQKDFLQFFCFQYLMIHPKAKWADEKYFNNPLSGGPYMLKDWQPGSPTITLVENPNYTRGPMAVKQIELVSVPDLTSRTLQLAQGDLDYVFDLAPSVRGVISKEVTTFPHPIGGMYHVIFNLKPNNNADAPWLNRDVREAISLAIDRDTISKRAFFGISAPAKGFMYSGRPESYEQFPNGGKRDIEAAKKLLATTPAKDGFAFTLTAWDRPGWRDAALVIKENLADLKITVNVEAVPDATAIAMLDSGNYQAEFSGNAGFPPITVMGNQFLKGSGWATWGRYDSPQMTQLFADISAQADSAKRIEAFKKMLDQAYKDMPLIPISERAVLSGTRVPREIFRAITNGENFWVARMDQLK